jgi:hypothetical protein
VTDRRTLHISKIDEFARWAVEHGYVREPVKGDYVVLRLRKRFPTRDAPLVFYQKLPPTEHVTAYGDGYRLISQWLKLRKNGIEGRQSAVASADDKGHDATKVPTEPHSRVESSSSPSPVLNDIVAVHEYLMKNQPVWYDPLLRDMDAQLCKAASALRSGLPVPEFKLKESAK